MDSNENSWQRATPHQIKDLEKKIAVENKLREEQGIDTLLVLDCESYWPEVLRVRGRTHYLVQTDDAYAPFYVVYAEAGRLSGYWPS